MLDINKYVVRAFRIMSNECMIRINVFFINIIFLSDENSTVWVVHFFVFCLQNTTCPPSPPPPHRMTKEQRRRIKTDEKAKVFAAAWLTEFIQFLATLAILP